MIWMFGSGQVTCSLTNLCRPIPLFSSGGRLKPGPRPLWTDYIRVDSNSEITNLRPRREQTRPWPLGQTHSADWKSIQKIFPRFIPNTWCRCNWTCNMGIVFSGAITHNPYPLRLCVWSHMLKARNFHSRMQRQKLSLILWLEIQKACPIISLLLYYSCNLVGLSGILKYEKLSHYLRNITTWVIIL